MDALRNLAFQVSRFAFRVSGQHAAKGFMFPQNEILNQKSRTLKSETIELLARYAACPSLTVGLLRFGPELAEARP
jgi:hypothetical protein